MSTGSVRIYSVGVLLLALFVITSSFPSLSPSITDDGNTSVPLSTSTTLLSHLPTTEITNTDNQTIVNDLGDMHILDGTTVNDLGDMHILNGTTVNDQGDMHVLDGTECIDGILLGVWLPQDNISVGDRLFRGTVYFFVLCYLFVGIAIVSDRFMAAIEGITSNERKVKVRKPNGEVQVVMVRVWNETVANLTLMALGSSSPEILLSIIEIIGKNFKAGDLGPGTIVGSAAYNLFIIIAICVVVIPKGETRKIKHLRVFFITAFASVFAYVWLYLILSVFSPGQVEVWEAFLTFIFFPGTVLTAYIAEKRLLFYKYLSKEYRMNKRGVLVQSEALALQKNGHTQSEVEPLRKNSHQKAVSLGNSVELYDEEKEFEEARQEYMAILQAARTQYPHSSLEHLEILAQERLMKTEPKSRAFYRVQATRKLMGSGDIMRKIAEHAEHDLSEVKAELRLEGVQEDNSICRVFFDPGHYTVMESCGQFQVRVVRRGDLSKHTTVNYETEDGSAEAGSDYISKKGTLIFSPHVTEQRFTIDIIDDDVYEQEEQFYIRLSNVSEPAVLSKPNVATVSIFDDDHAGSFSFSSKDHELTESVGVYNIKVERNFGARGKVIVPYWTEDGTAKAGKDYEPLQGELEFDNNESEKDIQLVVLEEGSYEKEVYLCVKLGEPRIVEDELANAIENAEAKAPEDLTEEDKMALLGRPKLGEITKALLTIRESIEFKATVDKLVQRAHSSTLIGTSTWKQQFIDATTVNPGDDNAVPTRMDYLMHYIALPWKFLFAFIPPTDIYGGYICFVVSIVCIGYLTTIVGDVAAHFGCTLGIKDSVTAICLVALGTSLPDTFASKISAVNDKTADNSIGNVTGSNAVNVFLGIGIAWTLAAVYHAYHGNAFEVNPGSLAFSLSLFLVEAFIAFAVILARRNNRVGGELGGPVGLKYATTAFLILLWVIYLIVSTLEAYGVIEGF